MLTIVQAKVRAFRLRLDRLYLAVPEEGEFDWWRVVKIGSGILIGWWVLYVMMFIRSLI